MGIWTGILDLIYPDKRRCLNCGNIIKFPEISGLCQECLQGVKFINHFCLSCGRAISEGEDDHCFFCQQEKPYYDKARGVALYSGVMRDLIIKFKYENRKELKKPLSEFLILYLKEYFEQIEIDYILPIPLHENRKNERGYNQAELLAEGLMEGTGIQYLDCCLVRVKNSDPLFNLGLNERQKMIRGSFSLKNPDIVKGTSILLLDDIFTTGTTVNEASRVLKNYGQVNDVYVLTLGTGKIGTGKIHN